MNQPSKPPVVFVHGMFMTGASWEGWVERFGARNHTCHAPSWPGRAGAPEQLRSAPDALLETLTLGDVVDGYATLINSLEEAPVLVGHSMGGLVVQLLLQRGLGRAGVAIDSAPPKGVSSFKWSFLKNNAATVFPSRKPIVPSVSWFSSAFANSLSAEEASDAYASWCVPESRLVGRGPLSDAAKIDFTRARPPLLLTAGEADQIIPASLTARNHAAYRAADAITDLEVFPGRSHWICRESGWQEVADHCADWLDRQLAS